MGIFILRHMTTATKKQSEESIAELEETAQFDLHALILCNDDINSFDFVMDTLIKLCKHSKEQAEQCALITHYKGSCDIKIGEFETLLPIKRALIEKGLTAIVEKVAH